MDKYSLQCFDFNCFDFDTSRFTYKSILMPHRKFHFKQRNRFVKMFVEAKKNRMMDKKNTKRILGRFIYSHKKLSEIRIKNEKGNSLFELQMNVEKKEMSLFQCTNPMWKKSDRIRAVSIGHWMHAASRCVNQTSPPLFFSYVRSRHFHHYTRKRGRHCTHWLPSYISFSTPTERTCFSLWGYFSSFNWIFF